MKRASIRRQKVSKSQQKEKKIPSNDMVWDNIDFEHNYRQMIMAIKTKPFLILAGISGTGKSRFTRMLSHKCCTDKFKKIGGDPGNFLLIQVQADWHDAHNLLGYKNSKGLYEVTDFILFLVKAWKNVDIPFILCLDEMNLAKVERYFASFLSIIESRRFEGAKLISDAFITAENILQYSKKDRTFWSRLCINTYPHLQQHFANDGIKMPPNLIVIGTMNIDESESISKKVLDRAMTFDMSEIDMYKGLTFRSNDFQYPKDYLPAHYLLGGMNDGYDAYQLSKEDGDTVINVLIEIDFILANSKFRFGYRTRNEILIYCYFNGLLPGKPDNWLDICIDEMILIKILPKLEGKFDRSELLTKLLEITIKYPNSHQKLLEIKASSLDGGFGYASFFE